MADERKKKSFPKIAHCCSYGHSDYLLIAIYSMFQAWHVHNSDAFSIELQFYLLRFFTSFFLFFEKVFLFWPFNKFWIDVKMSLEVFLANKIPSTMRCQTKYKSKHIKKTTTFVSNSLRIFLRILRSVISWNNSVCCDDIFLEVPNVVCLWEIFFLKKKIIKYCRFRLILQ